MPLPSLVMPAAGSKAPDFKAQATKGEWVTLSSFKGRHLLLYFYPKDDTSGCTKEACAFRDAYQEFQKLDTTVLGVSCDPIESHGKFTKKFELPFGLLADVSKEIVNAYGVWGMKSFMGRKYEGIHRVSFLIGPDGRILKVYAKVKPDTHAEEVLADLKEIKKKG